MLSTITAISAAVTLALTGAIAGLFYAFTVAVMPALDAIKAEYAIRAMQSINRKILNPVFLATFILAPVAAAVMGGLLLSDGQTWAAIVVFLAAATYVFGAFVPTMVVNVPLNDALDAADVPSDPNEAAKLWSDYSGQWTRWNTIRTLFSTLSLLIVGLCIFAWGREW